MKRLLSMPSLTLLYVLISLVTVGLGLPLIMRRVPPNDLYGFRVPKTLDNPLVWYPANAFAGYCLLASGIVLAAAALALRRWSPGLSSITYTLTCTLVLVTTTSLAVLFSFLYLQSLPEP